MAAGIEFECPHCGRVTRVPADLAGKQGRCAECRKILEVPNPDIEGSARRTSHLRQADRAGFELASSTHEGPKLPEQTMRKWDFGQLPLWVWGVFAVGPIVVPIPLAFGVYGIAAGHARRQRELAVCGWAGLAEVQVIWLLYSVLKIGLFALPLITIGMTILLAAVHAKWIAALIRREWVPR